MRDAMTRATLSHGQACPDTKVTEVLPLVYLHGGGIRVNIRLEQHKLCTLVMIGSAPTGARSSSPMLTGTASPRSRGLTCCATAPATRLGLRAARHRPVDREPDRILGRRNPLDHGLARGGVHLPRLCHGDRGAADPHHTPQIRPAHGGSCLSATRRYTIHPAMTPMALDAALLKRTAT